MVNIMGPTFFTCKRCEASDDLCAAVSMLFSNAAVCMLFSVAPKGSKNHSKGGYQKITGCASGRCEMTSHSSVSGSQTRANRSSSMCSLRCERISARVLVSLSLDSNVNTTSPHKFWLKSVDAISFPSQSW